MISLFMKLLESEKKNGATSPITIRSSAAARVHHGGSARSIETRHSCSWARSSPQPPEGVAASELPSRRPVEAPELGDPWPPTSGGAGVSLTPPPWSLRRAALEAAAP